MQKQEYIIYPSDNIIGFAMESRERHPHLRMPLFRFPILFRANGYEAIMRSHAVLRGFRHDLGLDIADNLFSCDYGGSAYDRGI